VEVRTLQGHVWSAGSSRPVPVTGAEVTVAGIESTRVTVDSSGSFRIEEQLIVRGHPLFLDTDVKGGFTHRYSVDPRSMQSIALFRFTDTELLKWIGQLNGGVHAESGVLVAALPDVVAAFPRTQLTPFIQSIEERLPFSPEVYTIAPDRHGQDRLEVKRPLDTRSSRVFAAELPSGAHILGLEDDRGQMLWSRWFVSDSGVVNVLGPQ